MFGDHWKVKVEDAIREALVTPFCLYQAVRQTELSDLCRSETSRQARSYKVRGGEAKIAVSE